MRQTSRPPSLPPVPGHPPTTGQGPLRHELLEQIAILEQELTLLTVRAGRTATYRANRRRGPRRQSTAALEEIRDELVDAIMYLSANAERGRS